MADYGIFRTADAKRIAAAVRRVEGSPRAFLRVPERVARSGGGGGAIDISGALLGAWTVSEHEPLLGETIDTWNRGMAKDSRLASDYDVILTSDNKIFTNGDTTTGGTNGVGVLLDEETNEREWRADSSGLAFHVDSLFNVIGTRGKCVLEADDGFLWLAGNGSLGRINPDTGVFTGRSLTSSAAAALYSCPTSGSIIASPGASSVLLAVLNSSVSETHTFGVITGSFCDVKGSVAVATNGGSDTITLLSATDLSTTDSRVEATWTSVNSVTTDGTYVFVVTGETKIRAVDIANLATDVWNVVNPGAAATTTLIENDGKLYVVYGTTTLTVRKLNPTTGATLWTSAALFGSLTNAGASVRGRVGFGSDFIVLTSAGEGGTLGAASGQNVACLNDSNGTTRWTDWDGWQYPTGSTITMDAQAFGVHVTDDDRIFIAHTRKQQ